VFVLGLILSALIGFSLGLIGGGGAILAVPILVYVLGIDARAAVAMSLAIVGITAALGAYMHARRGTLRLATGLMFAALGVVGAFFGARLTYLLRREVLLLIFAAIMVAAATAMLMRPSEKTVQSRGAAVVLVAGFGVGVLTGFLGVGGGFLIVPALVFFAGLDMRDAVGTSLLVIAINSFAGLSGHLLRAGANLDVNLTLILVAIATAGMLLGARLSHRISPQMLKACFALLVIAMALFLVWKNLPAVIWPADAVLAPTVSAAVPELLPARSRTATAQRYRTSPATSSAPRPRLR
jgi:uncharacterized membrane protein YfcA